MKIRLIQVPYDTALYRTRMGSGPPCFLDNGAIDRLVGLGHEVSVATVDPRPALPAEIATAFEVMRGVADAVRTASAGDAFPLVLAGNCNTCVGTVGGLSPRRTGVVWFDAHADFETPDSSVTGSLDGMGLAILTGHCWRPLADGISGFVPVSEERVILAGIRDIEPSEQARLSASKITRLSDRDLAGGGAERRFVEALDRLAPHVDGIYLHIDLDVHDARIAPANQYRPPGGLTPPRLRQLVEMTADRIPLLAAALTAYDPAVDPERTTLASGLSLIETIAARAPC